MCVEVVSSEFVREVVSMSRRVLFCSVLPFGFVLSLFCFYGLVVRGEMFQRFGRPWFSMSSVLRIIVFKVPSSDAQFYDDPT